MEARPARSVNLALSARGIEALRVVDERMAGRLLERAVPMTGRMVHARDGRLDSQAYGLRGERLNSLDRADLNRALVDEVRAAPGVRLFFRHKLVRCDYDALELVFEADGARRTRPACLVVGCDGAYSKVREQMMRVERVAFSQHYIDEAYLELRMPPAPDGGFAVDPHHLHIWPRTPHMLIALPNPDRSFTCTLYAPFATFDSLRGDRAAQLDYFRGLFPDALPLIGEEAAVAAFADNPTSALVTMRCAPYHWRDRVVVLGDAAHAMVPFYGQGLNCGLEDVRVLLACLADRAVRADARAGLADALADYTRRRRPALDAIQDLAFANFPEMRHRVATPLYLVRRRLDNWLARLLGPRRWLPLYTMVTFRADISYADARRRSERQSRVVEGALGALGAGLAAAVGLYGWTRRR